MPVGALPLPHFENEDVDLGGDILLISNDPSEGVGVLYVIDISNPRAPVLRSAMPNGFIETGVPGIFGLPEPQEPGIGHTASCIRKCRFAYLAGKQFFDNTKCHRLVVDIGALQCGDPGGDGTGGPTYRYADENLPVGRRPAYRTRRNGGRRWPSNQPPSR